jgi:NAD(P)-dependent dehydrogenase (short-subunit alcohol dehydrogenase family)
MADERRIAIVTGGNRGMGLETCRQLGRRGYKVVLTSRERALGDAAAAKLHEEDGLEIEPFRLDLTRAEDIAALVMHARRRLGVIAFIPTPARR